MGKPEAVKKSTIVSVMIVKKVESIFANSVLLSTQGRFKSEIHVVPNYIYLSNSDSTVIMEFNVPEIKSEFSFYPEDYESSEIEIGNNVASFITRTDDWIKKKTVNVPTEEKRNLVISAFKELWNKSTREGEEFKNIPKKDSLGFHFKKSELSLLDDRLSHLEICGSDGDLCLLQRDIYTGNRVTLTANSDSSLFKTKRPDFGPVSVRTSDFKALFNFHQSLHINLYDNYALITSHNAPLTRIIISYCSFNEMKD